MRYFFAETDIGVQGRPRCWRKPFVFDAKRPSEHPRPVSDITRILERAQEGDSKAAGELLPLVYDELRRIAAAKMARELAGQTLQPTALVHEAWLRLAGDGSTRFANRAHFFVAASEAMRRVLVDRARRKLRQKRGGAGAEAVELDEAAIQAPADDEKILQVHEALESLAAQDPQKAQIVKLRFFVGLNHDEIAEALGVNERTVRRQWELAKVQLFQAIRSSN
jgi:RNA polymerase sigma factor (TIGR02999 family)